MITPQNLKKVVEEDHPEMTGDNVSSTKSTPPKMMRGKAPKKQLEDKNEETDDNESSTKSIPPKMMRGKAPKKQ